MKLKYTGLIVLSLGTMLSAASPEEITYTENINSTTKERTFYNKGFKDGFEIGKREGYAKGLEKAKKALEAYAKKIKSYEAGKYLSQKGKITPPRLYQSRKNGRFEVFVKGCEVRGQLSPADILLLPEIGESDTSSMSKISRSNGSKGSQTSDGVFLKGVDDGDNTPVAIPTASLKQKSSIVLRDTKFYRDLLRSSGILYTIEGNGGGLKAIFSNPREKQSFIASYNLEYGKDYE